MADENRKYIVIYEDQMTGYWTGTNLGVFRGIKGRDEASESAKNWRDGFERTNGYRPLTRVVDMTYTFELMGIN